MINKTHKKFNIAIIEYSPNDLVNLDLNQARTMAELFTSWSMRLAEAEYLVALYENGQPVPEELEHRHVDLSDFETA